MKTVLFIEDNTEIRENMCEILELANYKVLLAANGKQGAAVAIAQKPDIIICDIMMPELDGYGVIHLLQKNEETKDIPFIFLTAKTERSEMRKGMDLGADDYITKPFSGTELLSAIESRLKKVDSARASTPKTLNEFVEVLEDNKSLKQVFEESQDSNVYAKKQKIYTEGHRVFRLYYIESGQVKLYKTNEDGKDLIIAIHQAGDFFGYTALLEGTTYRETAEAIEDAEISSITKDVFEELLKTNADVASQFIRMLAGNVHEKEEQLLAIAYNSLRKKVAGALMTLYRKFKTDDGNAPLHMSRDNLASLAGTAKESLIRTLADFRDEGLIEIRGSDIIIHNEAKLEKMLN